MTYLRYFTPRSNARLRLVCLPHAGGTAATFRRWGPLLPEHVDALAIQYPGRHDRMTDPFVPDLAYLAASIIDELPRDLPLVYFGHSMGALIAYEMARFVEPRELIASSPPGKISGSVDACDDDLLDAVRRLGGSGVQLLDNPVIREIALPAIRHDFAMIARYESSGSGAHVLRCPVTVLAGQDDPVCSPTEARHWNERTTGRFDMRVFPGGHHYLEQQQAKVISFLAGVLRAPSVVDATSSGALRAVD